MPSHDPNPPSPRPPARGPAPSGPEAVRPPHPPGSRAQGVLVIGLSLVAVTAVAGSLLAAGGALPHASEPTAPATDGAPAAPAAEEEPVLVERVGEHVSYRYPEGWTVSEPSARWNTEASGVLTFQVVTAPGREHSFCLNVHETDTDDAGSREQQEEWESDLHDSTGISDVRRIALEEDASAPPGWDTTTLELTYTSTDWDEADRWVVWQYTIIAEEGRGYLLQSDVPAADRSEYEDLAREVFASFEPAL